MKKLLFILLLFSMICLAGCGKGENATFGSAAPIDLSRFQVTSEQIEAEHQEYSKLYCDYTADDMFMVDRILVTVYPFADHVLYTENDFAEIGCWDIEVIRERQIGEDGPVTTLCLYIPQTTKERILEAVKVLESRDDLYRVAPEMLIRPQTTS